MKANNSEVSSNMIRKACVDFSDVSSNEDVPLKSDNINNTLDFIPRVHEKENFKIFENKDDRFQNVHPLLGWYKHVGCYHVTSSWS